MTQIAAKLEDKLRALQREGEIWAGSVVSVDEDEATMVVLLDDDNQLPDVMLRAAVDDLKGIVLLPEVGSRVIIGSVDGPGRYALIRASQLAKVLINCDQVIINEGEFGGLPKVEALVDKINALEDDLNKLKKVFQAWTPVAQDGGAALKAASATWAGTTIQRTKKGDIENTKVQH